MPVLEPPYYLIQLSRYDQVLTGILPYHGSDQEGMVIRIHAREQPSRPIDASKSRLLEDRVWNAITTGWHVTPQLRCQLSVMYRVFSPSIQQQLGKILPRVASFFQFLQNTESEIQGQVNEMNEVSFSHVPPHQQLTRPTAS